MSPLWGGRNFRKEIIVWKNYGGERSVVATKRDQDICDKTTVGGRKKLMINLKSRASVKIR